MKINNDLIKKIFDGKIKITNKSDKTKLSSYQEIIPMYDIYTERIFPIKKENLYQRLIKNHYRFINEEVKQWMKNKYSKSNDPIFKKNLEIIENYDIETLKRSSYTSLYQNSRELGRLVSICKRNSFHRLAKHLVPYYSKDELIKLGMNMGAINTEDINIDDRETYYHVCRKISKNDVSEKEISSHNYFIINQNLISFVAYYSFMGSYFMNSFLRHNKNEDHLLIKNINKFSEGIVNAPPVKNEYFLYRFVWEDSFLKNLKIGDLFIDKGFVSATRDPFYSPGLESRFGLILLKIKIPANKKGVGLFIENFSLFPNEEEYLFAPCSRFKLISKNEKFKYYHTHKEFERLINKKYEFEYIDNKFNKYTLPKKLNRFVPFNFETELEGEDRIELLLNFLKIYKEKENLLSFEYDGFKYTIHYNWFDGSDSYSKFYYNNNINGMLFSIYKQNYPYLTIELGDEMVINYLNQFYYYDEKKYLEEFDLKLLGLLAYHFGYTKYKIYLEYSNFKEFNKDQYAYIYFYPERLYRYLKYGNKFYDDFKNSKYYLIYNFGYYNIDKLKTIKLDKKIRDRFLDTNLKSDNYFDFIIEVIENYFYFFPKIISIFDALDLPNIFRNLFVDIKVNNYLRINGIKYTTKEIKHSFDRVEDDENFKLIFRQPTRRLI